MAITYSLSLVVPATLHEPCGLSRKLWWWKAGSNDILTWMGEVGWTEREIEQVYPWTRDVV